ncbi:MAG: sulfatase-like hydrolase/transferase [Gemmobacter sp.]
MKNFLFISIEDLNDWIEPLGGHPDARTPRLSGFAQNAAVFERAYAAAPACSPSRTATLFGRYPWESGIFGNHQKWYDAFAPDGSECFLSDLKRAGFTLHGAGKVFHQSKSAPQELFEEFYVPDRGSFKPISRSVHAQSIGRGSDFGPHPEGGQFDERAVDWIINRFKPGSERKVWCLGLFRPHTPFIVPNEYFDRIPEVVALPPGLQGNTFDPESPLPFRGLPEEAQRLAVMQSGIGKALVAHGEYNAFVRAYLASIAFADDMFGRVMDGLHSAGLTDDTLVVLWSDHGWQLGEKLAFRKFTLWERALRVPFMISTGSKGIGRRITDPVSLVDLAPTVLDLLGVEQTQKYSGFSLESHVNGTPSVITRPGVPSVWGVNWQRKPRLGFSVRGNRFRYTEYWQDGCELYDHQTDPFEHNNLMSGNNAEDFVNLPEVLPLIQFCKELKELAPRDPS